MANTTVDLRVWFRGDVERFVMPIQASTKVYMGSACTKDTSGNVGERADGERFMGISTSPIDNSSGSAAAEGRNVEMYSRGSFRLPVSGAAANDEGKAVFCGDDDQTFSYNPKKAQYVGYVEQFDSTGKVWVRMDNPGARNWRTHVSLADDGSIDLPDAAEAIVIVTGGDEGGVFHVASDGAVTKLSGTTNAVATDSDTDLCVFDNGTAARVRNRLGSTKTIHITYFGQ